MAKLKFSNVVCFFAGCGMAVLCFVTVLWMVFYFGIYFGYQGYKHWGNQDFAKNGMLQIAPAAEMDELFSGCRHYITYSGRESVSTWNAVAFFGGRYKLVMQVPVQIESSTRGNAVGEPEFLLLQVSRVSVSDSGGVMASFSKNFKFGAAEWKKLLDANGDFSAIGFEIDRGPPVADFEAYAKAAR